MNKSIEYYLGYLRNPKQESAKEIQVIVMHEYNDYREVATREKIFVMDKNQEFDGHQVFKSHAGFIGRIGKQLTPKEANEMITDIRKNKMESYINSLYTLIYDTLEMYMEGEKNYQGIERKK